MPLNDCIACNSPADDEYHWWDGEIERVWYLCADCCEFACDVVEVIANIETEVETWIHRNCGS